MWNFTKHELLKKIHRRKKLSRSIIDSARLIGRFLRELSVNDNFHQQFKSTLLKSDIKSDIKSLLGMQLYILLHEDEKKWIFKKPDGQEFIFANANYVISGE